MLTVNEIRVATGERNFCGWLVRLGYRDRWWHLWNPKLSYSDLVIRKFQWETERLISERRKEAVEE